MRKLLKFELILSVSVPISPKLNYQYLNTSQARTKKYVFFNLNNISAKSDGLSLSLQYGSNSMILKSSKKEGINEKDSLYSIMKWEQPSNYN